MPVTIARGSAAFLMARPHAADVALTTSFGRMDLVNSSSSAMKSAA